MTDYGAKTIADAIIMIARAIIIAAAIMNGAVSYTDIALRRLRGDQ